MTMVSFFLGGSVFCLYPIGISHACDRVNSSQIVSATQTLLLAYGVGATLGPLLAPIGGLYFTGSGLLFFTMIVCAALGLFMIWRKSRVLSVSDDEKHDFSLSVEMTPVAVELETKPGFDEVR